MRRAARTDANHEAIVRALRKVGATAISLAAIGKGCPDVLAGFRGRNLLLEIKDGAKPPSERKLTSDQVAFHESWAGQVVVVTSVEEAVRVVVESARPVGESRAEVAS